MTWRWPVPWKSSCRVGGLLKGLWLSRGALWPSAFQPPPFLSGMQLLGLELQQPTLEQKERAWLFSDGRGRFALSQGKN